MKTPVFTGSSTAIITPFMSGRVDYGAMADLLNMQRLAGTAAITVCGTTGEAVTMTPEEQAETIHFCVSHSFGMKIIAGAGSNDTSHALELSLSAQEAGADALLIVTPYYNKPTQTGLIEHYTRIADSVSIPIILYNVPSRTGVSLTAETCRELSGHPRINGIKEASGDLTLLSRILLLCGDELNVWSGSDDLTLPMMALGAKGVISVAANIIPEAMAQLSGLCLEGKFEDAARIHLHYFELLKALFMVSNPIPVKIAAAAMGLCSDELRPPLCKPDSETCEKLITILKKHGIV
ncbi:MAG: 4-hydroxy-tetrahydrodipicolinate synthase [Oscillospiraceae bacterium]